jgi:hypothetical protein
MSLQDVLPIVVAFTVQFVLPLSSVFAFTVPDVSEVWEHVVPVCSVRNDCKTPS